MTMRALLARVRQYVIEGSDVFRVTPEPVVGSQLSHFEVLGPSQAGELVEALLALPAPFRRELYRLITEDFPESFNDVPHAKSTKVHGPVKGSPRGGRR